MRLARQVAVCWSHEGRKGTPSRGKGLCKRLRAWQIGRCRERLGRSLGWGGGDRAQVMAERVRDGGRFWTDCKGTGG